MKDVKGLNRGGQLESDLLLYLPALACSQSQPLRDGLALAITVVGRTLAC
jgi:hypothetical protein